jgi:hypothetical protein
MPAAPKGRQSKVHRCEDSVKRTYVRTLVVDRLYQDLHILCLTPYPGGAEAIGLRLYENTRFYTARGRNPDDR